MAWLTLEDEKLDRYLLPDSSLVPVEPTTMMGDKEAWDKGYCFNYVIQKFKICNRHSSDAQKHKF